MRSHVKPSEKNLGYSYRRDGDIYHVMLACSIALAANCAVSVMLLDGLSILLPPTASFALLFSMSAMEIRRTRRLWISEARRMIAAEMQAKSIAACREYNLPGAGLLEEAAEARSQTLDNPSSLE